MAKYASGNQERLRLGFINNNENDTSLRVVGRVGIGTTIFDASSSLDVRGDVSISGQLTIAGNTLGEDTNTRNLNVSGVSTFAGAANFNSDLDVDGHTELDDLNVSGVSTFAGASDFNGDVDIDGHTELDDLNVSGVSTFVDNIDANGNLDVDGHTELDNLNVSGVSTFTGIIDANSGLDVTGVVTATAFHTGVEGSSIRITSNTISGPAEMFIDPAAVGDNTGILRIKGDLFVDGTQTIINSSTIELADFVVGIASTATTDLLADGAGIEIGPDNTFKYHYNSGTNPSLKSSENLNVASGKAYQIDQTEVLNATTLGSGVVNSSLTSVGNLTSLTVDGRIVGAATSNVIPFLYAGLSDLPSASTYHGAFAHVHATGAAYYAHAGNWLELVNKDTNGNVGLSGDLDVDGHTELDNLNVSGISTFQGDIFLPNDDQKINVGNNNALQIYHDGTLNTSVIENSVGHLIVRNTSANTSSDVYIQSDNEVRISNIGANQTFAAFYNGAQVELYHNNVKKFQTTSDGVTITGTTLTNQLNVSGVSTFTGAIDANGDLDVDGHTELDDLNVSGVSTFTGTINANGDLDVDGHTELDNLNVSGVSTFVGTADFNGDVDIDGHTELDNLNVSGVSTFTGAIDANGDLDVDGHTELDDLNVSGVSTFQNDVHFGDGDKINLGDNDDFQIFHHSNGTGIIQNAGSGQLQIRSDEIRLLNQATDEDYAFFRDDGAVELYYDNSKKLETTGIGVSIYDDLNVGTGVTIYGNSGIVSATAFYGDGINLANTGATLNAAAGTQRLVLTSLTSNTMIDAATDADLTFNATTNTLDSANLNVSGYTGLSSLTVSGIATFTNTAEFDANVRIDSTLSANGSVGNLGQYLQSTGIGVSWATFPTLRSTQTNTASAGQTTFNFSYNVNFLDVFVNGVKLTSSEYTATDGNQIILDTPAFAGEVIEFHSYNTTSYGGGGGGGGGASNLNDLSDVSIGTLAANQLLQYNNATSQWVNVSATSVVNAASSFATKSATATTATAGQTTFNGTYTVGFVDVYLNGVKLSEDQYTATTGTNIVLDEGASENDIIEVVGLTSNVPGSVNTNDIVHSTWTLGANGTSHWTFTGPGGLSNTDDPKIYLARGQTYEFVNNSGGSHFFQIQDSGGTAYSTGVTNNGASSGTIRFEVPFSAPNTLQYKCTSHSSMGNTIIVYPDISP